MRADEINSPSAPPNGVPSGKHWVKNAEIKAIERAIQPTNAVINKQFPRALRKVVR